MASPRATGGKNRDISSLAERLPQGLPLANSSINKANMTEHIPRPERRQRTGISESIRQEYNIRHTQEQDENLSTWESALQKLGPPKMPATERKQRALNKSISESPLARPVKHLSGTKAIPVLPVSQRPNSSLFNEVSETSTRTTPARAAKNNVQYKPRLDSISDSEDESQSEISGVYTEDRSDSESDRSSVELNTEGNEDWNTNKPIPQHNMSRPSNMVLLETSEGQRNDELADESMQRREARREQRTNHIRDFYASDASLFNSSIFSHSDEFEPPHPVVPAINTLLQHPHSPLLRNITPPPGQGPTRGRLTSPTKKQKNPVLLPPASKASRPSIDPGFWDSETVNTFNDTLSPSRVVRSTSPFKTNLQSPALPGQPRQPDSNSSGTESSFDPPFQTAPSSPVKQPRSLSPSKIPAPRPPSFRKQQQALKAAFDSRKKDIAESFLAELDAQITSNEIGRLTKLTGGVQIIWSKKLNTTAGRANWRREVVRINRSARSASPEDQQSDIVHRHIANIELATKVISTEEQLLNVLAHEFCHLANFIILGVTDQPHGASFQKWAKQVSKRFRGRGVEVTTKHEFDIVWKYVWTCQGPKRHPDVSEQPATAGGHGQGSDDLLDIGCGMEYGRHSRSIDPLKHKCGRCGGMLVQVRPVPKARRNCALPPTATGPIQQPPLPKTPSAYQNFVKTDFARVKKELEDVSHQRSPAKDVLAELGRQYRAHKQAGVKSSHAGNKKRAERIEISSLDISDDDILEREINGNIVANDIENNFGFLTLNE